MLFSGLTQDVFLRCALILAPLLFNTFTCDMFFETPEIIDFGYIDDNGYVDDNTLYTYSSKIEHLLTNLQGTSEKFFR